MDKYVLTNDLYISHSDLNHFDCFCSHFGGRIDAGCIVMPPNSDHHVWIGHRSNAALIAGPAQLRHWQRVRVTMAQFHCAAPEPAVKPAMPPLAALIWEGKLVWPAARLRQSCLTRPSRAGLRLNWAILTNLYNKDKQLGSHVRVGHRNKCSIGTRSCPPRAMAAGVGVENWCGPIMSNLPESGGIASKLSHFDEPL